MNINYYNIVDATDGQNINLQYFIDNGYITHLASKNMRVGAIGCAIGPAGLIRVETERNASFRTTEYVATGFWGQVEIHDGYGVYILTDVS